MSALNADADDAGQEPYHRMNSLLGRLLESLQACPLDLFDLVHDEAQARHVPPQLGKRIRLDGNQPPPRRRVGDDPLPRCPHHRPDRPSSSVRPEPDSAKTKWRRRPAAAAPPRRPERVVLIAVALLTAARPSRAPRVFHRPGFRRNLDGPNAILLEYVGTAQLSQLTHARRYSWVRNSTASSSGIRSTAASQCKRSRCIESLR